MKYKLLKDLPLFKAGTIKSEGEWVKFIDITLGTSPEYEDWFEPVEEFKKKIFIPSKWDCNPFEHAILETFATEEQAKAKKALLEHVYKFEEPKTHRLTHHYKSDGFMAIPNYCNSSHEILGYHAGLIMNEHSTYKDREERIQLLNNYINSLKS